MARKSAKQARFDALSQRQQNKQLKDKLYTRRKDGNRWGDRMLSRLHALKNEGTETDGAEMESVDNNLKTE